MKSARTFSKEATVRWALDSTTETGPSASETVCIIAWYVKSSPGAFGLALTKMETGAEETLACSLPWKVAIALT